MQLSPHLQFCGQCEEAFRFYERSLGGKIVTMLTYGDSPMAEQVSAGLHDKIVHATLTLGDGVLTGADIDPEEYERPQGFCVLVHPSSTVESRRIFGELAEQGTVRIPLQKTFWSPSYGLLVDRFGVPWEISCEGPSQ
jgi:PhnB protein